MVAEGQREGRPEAGRNALSPARQHREVGSEPEPEARAVHTATAPPALLGALGRSEDPLEDLPRGAAR